MLRDEIIDEIKSNALDIRDRAGKKVEEALDKYVQAESAGFHDQRLHVLPNFVRRDRCYCARRRYAQRCSIVEQVTSIFRERLYWITARIHFFFELSDVAEQLDFLIDEVIENQRTDPDDFLQRIGGDVDYWERFLSVYRSDSRQAAQLALVSSLTGVRLTRLSP